MSNRTLAEWLILKIDPVIDYTSLMLKYVDTGINNKKGSWN